jgi:methionyl-tRNA formyltransferase
MRLVVFSWCRTSVTEALERAGAHVVEVVTGSTCRDVNDVGFVERMRGLAPDLLVVAGCSQKLREPIRRVARLGTVNFHPSLLPYYRAREPLFWTILAGETRAGITVHIMTDAIDEGPILFQREVEVSLRATSESLASRVDEAACGLAADLLACESEGSLPEGRVSTEPGSRYPPVRSENGLIDWTRSAIDIDRRVRACTGAIEAYALVRGVRLVVEQAEPVTSGVWKPKSVGQLVAKEEHAQGHTLVVAAGRDFVRVLQWHLSNGVNAPEELETWLPLTVGKRLS